MPGVGLLDVAKSLQLLLVSAPPGYPTALLLAPAAVPGESAARNPELARRPRWPVSEHRGCDHASFCSFVAMRIPFLRAGLHGEVSVVVELVEDPVAIGKPAGTEGFPSCQATVRYPGRGYNALFGWVQLVRAEDFSGGHFALDPLRFFEDTSAPHCFYGISPTLFDAPSRDERYELDWTAHSFLTPISLFEVDPKVRPLLGFSWGFDIDPESVLTLKPTKALAASDWERHVPYLSDCFPTWRFAPMVPA